VDGPGNVYLPKNWPYSRRLVYTAVGLLDRYLSTLVPEQIMRPKLQLVGIVAMFIAHHHAEDFDVERTKEKKGAHTLAVEHDALVRFCVEITDSTYTEEEVVTCERKMLCALKEDVSNPGPNVHHFLARIEQSMVNGGADDQQQLHLTRFISESMLQEYTMIKYPPSMLAAASLNLARRTLAGPAEPAVWTEDIEATTGYAAADIGQCLHEMSRCMYQAAREAGSSFVRDKFSEAAYASVASRAHQISIVSAPNQS
jgi:hypothetical protein